MSITPQLIKDQEFEVKFRGFDPIEVKDYLESIADKFFELQEQCKEQEDELELLRTGKQSSEEYSSSLETDMEFTRKISEDLKDGCAQKEEKIIELSAEMEELQLRIADMEQDREENSEEVSAVEAAKEEAEEALKAEKSESDSLRNKIEMLHEQNNDLKKEEVDFKSTLAAAQRFTEDLKEKSRAEAEEMVANAHAEIEKIRDGAQAELDRLPKEIEVLENKKHTVKAELLAILQGYKDGIDVFPSKEKDVTDDLFQKIELDEDGGLTPEAVAKLAAAKDGQSVVTDMDEQVLDSLLRGETSATEKDDDFDLKGMFSLDSEEQK